MTTFTVYELVSLINQQKIDLFDKLVATDGGHAFKSELLTLLEAELESLLKEPAGSSDLAFKDEGTSKSPYKGVVIREITETEEKLHREPRDEADKLKGTEYKDKEGEDEHKASEEPTVTDLPPPKRQGKLSRALSSMLGKSRKVTKPWHKQQIYEIRGGGEVFQMLEGSPLGDLGFEGVVETFNETEMQKDIDLIKQLPQQFNVRTWENRRNLFQVAVLGPEETVFDSALFIFDIKLPETYPKDPPIVRYMGRHVLGGMLEGCNGVLNEDYVKSIWLPSKKISQLLLGLQGGGVFFDEKLTGPRKEGQLLVWNMMLDLMKQPPLHLAKEIVLHFNAIFPILTFRFQEAIEQERVKSDEYRRINLMRIDLEGEILKATWKEDVATKNKGLFDRVANFVQAKGKGKGKV